MFNSNPIEVNRNAWNAGKYAENIQNLNKNAKMQIGFCEGWMKACSIEKWINNTTYKNKHTKDVLLKMHQCQCKTLICLFF